ncbi:MULTISPECIES: hypothetical protein [Streptomyces]|uniref:hypothetical protein n=1 Tax=Streptomyces TaxID=1883 RepID=UPI001E4B5C92|nr:MULTISPECIES: hypothetical protein [Streptomyces]UFQ16436.1 hypothetical protein J2N69_16285 [Streptomyces huasconensis]WCL86038.1 hypothetical protein PPN52_16295 [Streptomyces sp. JCM 35825]
MTTPTNDALWAQLADALNALEDAGLNVMFGDRKGPETDWWSAPYVYAGNWGGGPRTAWDRKRKRWTVEQR